MRAHDLIRVLNATSGNPEVVFEIKEGTEEPDTSYGIDEIVYTSTGFVVLRSVD